MSNPTFKIDYDQPYNSTPVPNFSQASYTTATEDLAQQQIIPAKTQAIPSPTELIDTKLYGSGKPRLVIIRGNIAK